MKRKILNYCLECAIAFLLASLATYILLVSSDKLHFVYGNY